MRQRAHVRRRVGRLKTDESGIALLMVLVTIAMLSAVVMEFVHQTRINVQMAANVRDRIKAYYLARSAVNFSRLILFYQGQVDRMTQGAVKLYQLVPIESDLAKALTSGELGEAFGLEDANLGDMRGFGEFDGGFSATIEDEYSKINLNALDSLPSIASPTAAQLLTLIGAPRYREMFEKPDADGKYTTPAELVAAIHDWIDSDNTCDSFQPNVLAASPISHTEIFTQGSSSEDSNYDMLDDPYKAKNNPLLTVDELHLVRGVDDDFMDEFASRFTVYSDRNLLLNLSSVNDPLTMLTVLCMQPDNMPLCTAQDQSQLLDILSMFFEFRNMMQWTTFMVPTGQAIQQFFNGMGATLTNEFMKSVAPFSDTFRVLAQGRSGEVTVEINTVLKNTVSGQEIMYWRVM